MKFGYLAAAAIAAASTGLVVPAYAQDAAAPAAPAEAPAAAATVAAGATIYGPDGSEVGTIGELVGENATINTGNVTATVPQSAITPGAKGLTIGWNKADLEAAVASAEQASSAALDGALVAGAQVFTVDGEAIGAVKELNAEGMVVVEHTTAGPISLPKAQFALQQDKVTFLATSADLQAALSGSASS